MKMHYISFNPFRTLGIPNVQYVKPENMLKEELKIKTASWLLFPEYWQVNSLVYGWQKKIFPSINTYHLGHDKIEMTRLFQVIAPGNVPHTLILGNKEGIADQIIDELSFPFIAKVIRSSEGKGVSLIQNRKELNKYLLENQTLYLQEYLPINRDLRVVYIGDRVFSAYWRIGQGDNFRNNLAQGGEISYQNIPEEAVKLVENIARQTGINHAGFDITVVDGHYYLLEFNVFFGNKGLPGKMGEINNEIYRYLNANIGPKDTDGPPENRGVTTPA